VRVRTGAEAEDQADRVDQPSVAGFEPSVKPQPRNPGIPRAAATRGNDRSAEHRSPSAVTRHCHVAVFSHRTYG